MIAVIVFAFITGLPQAHQATDGALLYTQKCASCHGANLGGGPDGPPLRGVGAAAIDFWMSTGRMPAAVPWIEVAHRGPQLPPQEIAAIERYLAAVDPAGPPLPVVGSHGRATHGQELFVQNCEHCHGVDGAGASISNNEWAPSLRQATPLQIAEAIRTGPEQMPRFSNAQLAPADVDDVIAYVDQLDTRARAVNVPSTTSGPVPEGLVGWLVAGLLCVAAYVFSRDKRAKNTDDDSPNRP